MITIQGTIPRDICVAVSGGVDSIAILDFLANNHNITLVHINHKEGNSDKTADFINTLVDKYKCKSLFYSLDTSKPKRESIEEYWRKERFKIFHSIDKPVVTGHHLNDCVETWVWSSLHGEGKLIPYANKNVIRPFRLTPKKEFVKLANSRNLTWIEDESNEILTLTRNYIRKVMMPHILVVNPGIEKTIKKKVEKSNV